MKLKDIQTAFRQLIERLRIKRIKALQPVIRIKQIKPVFSPYADLINRLSKV